MKDLVASQTHFGFTNIGEVHTISVLEPFETPNFQMKHPVRNSTDCIKMNNDFSAAENNLVDTGDTSQVCCCFSKDTQECPNPLDLDYSEYDSLGVKNGNKPVMVSIFAQKALFYLG